MAAQVGISPSEFWGDAGDIYSGMSLREFDLFVQGYQKRLEVNREVLAWHAACIMNCWTKRKVSVEDLLGKKRKQLSTAELKEEMTKKNRDKEESVIGKVGDGERVLPSDVEEDGDKWIEGLMSSLS